MNMKALTIDFWNTLVVATSNGEIRRRDRLACLTDVACRCRPGLSDAEILRAFGEAERRFITVWERDHRTLGSSDLLRLIWEELRLEVAEPDHLGAVTRFEEGILSGPPLLTKGVRDALRWAAERYALGIISDTMFSPGRVIRDLLEREGVLQYFSASVFSDETGYSKPDGRAFAAALAGLNASPAETAHIGDLTRTDVAGANRAGLRSILYTGIHRDASTDSRPDAELPSWRALPRVIQSLESVTDRAAENA